METQTTLEQGLQYTDLHADYQTWIGELEFYKNEIGFFQRFLEVYARSQQNNKNGSMIEQFQNKLLLQGEQTDILLHDLKKLEQKLVDFVQSQSRGIIYVPLRDHKELRERVEIHRKLYAEIKLDFYRNFSHD